MTAGTPQGIIKAERLCTRRRIRSETERSQSMIPLKIAEVILAERHKRNMTQEELAAALGVTAQSVSKWERGGYPDIYFAWCNQTLSVFTLWAITVYLVREKKNYYITLLPALMMTLVCSTYICIAPEGLSLPQEVAYGLGGTCLLVALIWFNLWLKKETQKRL